MVQHETQSEAQVKANDPHLNASGWLEVGDGHQIYWEDWGNPKAKTAIIYSHGGPGGGFSDSAKAVFDPAVHRVIFHDQRGCGRSKPFASTEHNTTQDLVADIERLREHFGLEQVYVAGGSWGSTLSLAYAVAHPERVKRLLVWSIYLARREDNDWVNGGVLRAMRPAEWDRFVALVPKEHRVSGDSIMRYYAGKIRSQYEAEAKRYVLAWYVWEGSLMSINYDPQSFEVAAAADPSAISTALLETHYSLNDCFLPAGYILDNAQRLRDIPCVVVSGRFDLCTPPSAAYDLAEVYGKNLRLHWVNAGHLRSDPAMLEALQLLAAEHLR